MKRDHVNIGERLPRVETIVKDTRGAKYAGDLFLPGMLLDTLREKP